MKKSLIFLILVTFLVNGFLSLSGNAEDSVGYTPLSLPIITLGENNDTCHFTWVSPDNMHEYLQWTETENLVNGVMPEDCNMVRVSKEYAIDGRISRATATGLLPDTSYTYRVGGPYLGWGELYSFDTHSEDSSYSFIVLGDPQVGSGGLGEDIPNWDACGDYIKNYFGEEIEFIMSVGDNVDTSNSIEDYDAFTSFELFRNTPVISAPGNHDNGYNFYSRYFTYDNVDADTVTAAGAYSGDYWLDYDNTLIMTLNLNCTDFSLHASFMRSAIAEYTATYGEPEWKIVLLHQPIYSAGVRAMLEVTVEARNTLAPVFSELGVDVVLGGHDHAYTRSYMMQGAFPVKDKSLYEGNYDAMIDPADDLVLHLSLNSCSGSKYYDLYSSSMDFALVADQEYLPNLTKVDVSPNQMLFTTYKIASFSEEGEILDRFAIRRSGEGEDNTKPVLDMPSVSYIDDKEAFDPKKAVMAYDDREGDLLSKVEVAGEADLSSAFELSYSVSDEKGNTSTAKRSFLPYSSIDIFDCENQSWRYLDDGSNPFGEKYDTTSWAKAGFDVSTWKEGEASFGSVMGDYGYFGSQKQQKTLLNHFDSEGNSLANYFFRTEFDINDPEDVDVLTLGLLYDDGCSVYINGVMVDSFNAGLAENSLGYTGRSSVSADEYGYIKLTDSDIIASLDLKTTGNVLAIELFQSTADSSDIFLDITEFKCGYINEGVALEPKGVNLKFKYIDGVKDIFVGRGYLSSYREVKNNFVVQISSSKLEGKSEYKYLFDKAGVYTVYIKHKDSTVPDKIMHVTLTARDPVFAVKGLQLNIHELDDVKVIRTAYGEYSTPGEIKRAAGQRSFSGKLIQGEDYLIQYRENGRVSVGVVYNNGYEVMYYFDVLQKTPGFEQSGDTVTFTSLDDLKVIRYAKGVYSSSAEIKRAEGSVALTESKIVDGKISVTLAKGTYTFCVQYNDESFNYYRVTIV